MEQSMSDQLKMSYQPSLLNLTDATFSQGSGSGTTHSAEQDGGTVTGRCGQGRALASLSPRRAKEMGLLTSGTYGLRGSTLSSSADLASSLASKFRAKTRSLGSTLFTLTWKVRYTPSRRPIFAVRASGLRISDSGSISSGSWQTPKAHDGEFSTPRTTGRAMHKSTHLQTQAIALLTDRDESLASWPSPMAGTPAQNGYNEAGNTDSSRKTVELVSWPTPRVTTNTGGYGNAERGLNPKNCKLEDSVQLAASPWVTPQTKDFRTGQAKRYIEGKHAVSINDQVMLAQLTDSGEMPSGSIAATGNGVLSGQLNPGHSRWLMSLPPIWDVCGIRAADAIRSRRSSKKAKAASQGSEATATP